MTRLNACLTWIALCVGLLGATMLIAAIEITGPSGGASTLQQAFDGGNTMGQLTAANPLEFQGCTTETLRTYCDPTDGWIQVSSLGGALNQPYGLTPAVKSANYTIGTDDANECYGGVIYVTAAATITGCLMDADTHYTIITIGAFAVSYDPNAVDNVMLDTSVTPGGDGVAVTNSSVHGNKLVCSAYTAATMYCDGGAQWS